MKTKSILVLLGILLPFMSFYGQEEGTPTAHGFKVDFKLPTPTANGSFKGIMSGLADVDFAYQYTFKKPSIILNTGLKFGYWQLESSVFSGTNIHGKLLYYNPFIGAGYRQTLTEKLFLEYEFKAGYNFLSTTSTNLPDPYKQEGYTLEPKVSFFLKSSELLYFGAHLNYLYTNATFTPDNIGLTSFPGLDPASSVGKYQYFSIGFGFYMIIPSFK